MCVYVYKCFTPFSLATLQPFVDPAHFLHGYFLPRWYAVALPIGAGVLLLGFVGVFVAIVMIQDSAKKRAKAKKSE